MAEVTVDKKALIEGERPMYNASYGKLMMWFFLVSDAFTFSALLIAYGGLRVRAISEGLAWADPEQVFTHFPLLYEIWHIEAPLAFVGLMTFILILSSVTMVLAVEAGHRKSKKEVQKWVLLTMLGGLTFLSCQAYEWYHFIMGSDDGGLAIPSAVFEGMTIPGMEELERVEMYPIGEGHDVSGFTLFNGATITDPAMVNKILEDGSHTHAGTYTLDAALARRLDFPALEENLSVKGYAVENTDGKVFSIRLTNGIEIRDQVVVERVMENARETQGGANLRANEYGPAAFADLFFFVTGFHGTHVFSGVVLLFILLLNVRKGTYERRGHYEMTEKIGLYWHFVDLVWVFVFTFFYLV